jgi:hypothetical protein
MELFSLLIKRDGGTDATTSLFLLLTPDNPYRIYKKNTNKHFFSLSVSGVPHTSSIYIYISMDLFWKNVAVLYRAKRDAR